LSRRLTTAIIAAPVTLPAIVVTIAGYPAVPGTVSLLRQKGFVIYGKNNKPITFELGFEDLSYFSNFFKKLARISPLDFRNTASQKFEAAMLYIFHNPKKLSS
jgi:hypothetical protein